MSSSFATITFITTNELIILSQLDSLPLFVTFTDQLHLQIMQFSKKKKKNHLQIMLEQQHDTQFHYSSTTQLTTCASCVFFFFDTR